RTTTTASWLNPRAFVVGALPAGRRQDLLVVDANAARDRVSHQGVDGRTVVARQRDDRGLCLPQREEIYVRAPAGQRFRQARRVDAADLGLLELDRLDGDFLERGEAGALRLEVAD